MNDLTEVGGRGGRFAVRVEQLGSGLTNYVATPLLWLFAVYFAAHLTVAVADLITGNASVLGGLAAAATAPLFVLSITLFKGLVTRTVGRPVTVRSLTQDMRADGVLIGEALGVRRLRSGRLLAGDVWWGLVVGFALLGLTTIMGETFTWPSGVPDDPRDLRYSHPVLQNVLAGVLYAPLVEEVFYRGPLLLFVAFTRRTRLPRRQSLFLVLTLLLLLAQTALFAAAHPFSLFNQVTAGIVGLVFGALVLRRRTLLPAVLAHAVFNGLLAAVEAS